MTDNDLYEGIARKDDAAFRYLYQNHYNMIRAMVIKKGGSDDDALDIFQEGIVALWTNIRLEKYRLSPKARLSTYLYSVCSNIWLKKLRSRKPVTSLEDSPVDPVADDTVDFAADLGAEPDEEVMRLRRIFGQLGDKCRKILSLFYYEKASMREIAEAMGYEGNTAKNEKYRCMKRIRGLYQKGVS